MKAAEKTSGICKFEQVDLSGNITEFVEGSTLGTFENPTAGYSWQAPTSFDFLGVYPYQASSTAPDGTVLRIKSDIDASRKSNQLRLFYQFELPPPISTITTSYTTYDTVTASFAIPELNNLTFFGSMSAGGMTDNQFNQAQEWFEDLRDQLLNIVKDIDGNDMSFEKFKDKVVYVTNVASA